MRYLSLFSGIEAATVAWHSLGWECVGVAELEPFPCSVLAHYYPHTPNLGDVTKITESMIAALGPIDLVVFGSPCQDLSVAGKRKGLEDADGQLTRSGLFHIAIDIIGWAHEHCGARFALWENVPGAFSSNKGRDFAVVVGELASAACDVPPKGWGNEGCLAGEKAMVEWSTLDAQWFGVAQRRRRVFALADFGDWSNRPPILLEPEGLRGDSAPRRGEGQGIAGSLAARTRGGGGLGTDLDLDGGLIRADGVPEVAHSLRADGFDASEDGTGRGTPLVPVAYNATDYETGAFERVDCARGLTTSADRSRAAPIIAFSAKDHGADAGDIAPTLRGMGHAESHANGGGQIAIAIQGAATRENPASGPDGVGVRADDTAYTLEARQEVQAVAFESRFARNGRGAPSDVVPPLKAQSGESGKGDAAPLLATAMQIRRLTPVECARLQGFPDDYLDITYRGKPAADGPRYKALGNSMAVPVMRWIGRQLDLVKLFQ